MVAKRDLVFDGNRHPEDHRGDNQQQQARITDRQQQADHKHHQREEIRHIILAEFTQERHCKPRRQHRPQRIHP